MKACVVVLAAIGLVSCSLPENEEYDLKTPYKPPSVASPGISAQHAVVYSYQRLLEVKSILERMNLTQLPKCQRVVSEAPNHRVVENNGCQGYPNQRVQQKIFGRENFWWDTEAQPQARRLKNEDGASFISHFIYETDGLEVNFERPRKAGGLNGQGGLLERRSLELMREDGGLYYFEYVVEALDLFQQIFDEDQQAAEQGIEHYLRLSGQLKWIKGEVVAVQDLRANWLLQGERRYWKKKTNERFANSNPYFLKVRSDFKKNGVVGLENYCPRLFAARPISESEDVGAGFSFNVTHRGTAMEKTSGGVQYTIQKVQPLGESDLFFPHCADDKMSGFAISYGLLFIK